MPINFSIPGGRAHFGRFNSSGGKTGMRELSAIQGFTLTGSPNKIAAYVNSTGRTAKADETTTRVDYTAKTKLLDITTENLAMAFSGKTSSTIQASGTETGQEITAVGGGLLYQLGVTTTQKTGDRKVTVTGVQSKEGSSATAWAATTPYTTGQTKVPSAANTHWYMAEAGGTSAAAEPTWPLDGSTVVDGTVTWRDMGVIAYAPTVDYTVDDARGQLTTVTGGAIDLAAQRAKAIILPTTLGATVSLLVDYGKAALTRTQVIPAGSDVQGELLVNSEDLKGNGNDYYFAKVSITLDGDLVLINEPNSEAYQSIPITIEVLVDDPADPPFISERSIPA